MLNLTEPEILVTIEALDLLRAMRPACHDIAVQVSEKLVAEHPMTGSPARQPTQPPTSSLR